MSPKILPDLPKTTEEIIQQNVELQGQVIVEAVIHGKEEEPLDSRLVWLVNISDETYLYPDSSEKKIQMSHAFHIQKKPFSTVLHKGETFYFCLVFPGLPRDCTNFHIVEEKEGGGGFFFSSIDRNDSDVYRFILK
jgi:hypothetical protein